MVKPTIILLIVHIQKLTLAAVRKLPISNVAKHVKYAIRRPARSFNKPNKYTPIGPPVFNADNPIVG